MDFGKITLENLGDPKPSYEWTRNRLVKSINDYICTSLRDNVNVAQFGVKGLVEFPPSAPIPYLYPPNSGPSCGGVVSFVPGTATEADYDAVAAKTRNGDGSFWENYFELIGRALFRSKLTIEPYLSILKGYPSNSGFSTPFVYTISSLAGTQTFYRDYGVKFTERRALVDWRKAGETLTRQMRCGKFDDSREVWNLVGVRVRETAIRTTNLWRYYSGELKRSVDPYPGTFVGHIYGNLKFD